MKSKCGCLNGKFHFLFSAFPGMFSNTCNMSNISLPKVAKVYLRESTFWNNRIS